MAISFLLASSFASSTIAGPFSVTPVRIYMDTNDKAVAVTINNEGDDELVMQAELYTWTQKPDGEDVLEPTEDLLLSPPIIKLAGKSKQVVRLARLQPVGMDQQQTYRMIVREIPEAKPNKGNLQLQIAIAFSMPVFITPPGVKNKLDCHTSKKTTDTISISCENTGTAYAQVIDFTFNGPENLSLSDNASGGYILPGVKRNFNIKSEKGKLIPSGKGILSVRMDDGSKQTFDVILTE